MNAVAWVKNNHNIAINYHTLRWFMITNFETKLKQPRKSHYKKDELAFETFQKLPSLLQQIIKEKSSEFNCFNLYFQDEIRFGLQTDVGKCLTARGVIPIAKYPHAFKNTYLYGSFSPINGDSFVYEIEGTASEIFYAYISAFSKYKPA